jgi:hypothetical protein
MARRSHAATAAGPGAITAPRKLAATSVLGLMPWFAMGTFDSRSATPTNVRCWESNGLNADVAFGPFMTRSGHRIELGRKQVLSHDLAGMAGETDHKNVNPDGKGAKAVREGCGYFEGG